MDRRWMSHAILEDLESIKRSHEWGSQDARLKPSASLLDLPRTPYHERRSNLYAALPFVAVPGLAARTNDVVRNISYRMYVAEREQYKTTTPPHVFEPPRQQVPPRISAEYGTGEAKTGLVEMQEMDDRGRTLGVWRSCRQCASEPEKLNLSLVPRSKEEEALYVECQIAEDELRRDIVTAPMIMACLVACVSQFLCGYNTSVMNAPAEYVFPGHSTLSWSVAVASFAIGGPAGAVLGGYLANARGRRQALLFDAGVFLVGGLLMTLAPTMNWLIAGRFVVGVASGFASVLVPIYLGELAPPVLRGTFGTCTQFAMVIGILATDLIAFDFAQNWRVLFGMTPLLAAIQLLSAPHLLESPRWLLDRDETSQQARLALQKLYGFRDAEQIDYEVAHIVGANALHKLSQSQKSAINNNNLKTGFASIYDDDDVRPLLFASVALHVAQQLCGINAVFYYSTMFFNGVIDNPLLGTTLVAAINVLATWLAIIMMDSCGRKTLLAWSSGGMLACVLLITLALVGAIPKIAALVSVMLYVSFFEIGLGPIPWLIVAEMFDSRHVDTAQSIACQVNWLCNFLVGLAFPSVNAALGSWCFLPFGVVLAATFAFVLHTLPETRGASVREIQIDMAQRLGYEIEPRDLVKPDDLILEDHHLRNKGKDDHGGGELADDRLEPTTPVPPTTNGTPKYAQLPVNDPTP
ncbi:hypothetical protein CTAYLR_002360 [Chrysophaeum taylorii]|uniref:Hexose transporter 1 n=1 Tax=Chrysophaeum taylorii TaxID=2483200 RepID=A0AAD7UG73_9STRA|nr:hypothetical protein CTAYLR_002360 [Chrysophaeum taylorii]